MNMYTIILFIALMISFVVNVYLVSNRPVISVQRALKWLKKSLIRMIVFYQANYNESDQIVLVKKWLDSLDKSKIHPVQKKLFKRYVNQM
jgi:hypothetical protein